MFVRQACFVACIVLSACSAAAPSETEPSASQSDSLDAGQYVDARWYFSAPEDIDAWYALTHALKTQFDAICGDTFCEGDYSNYESLGVRCSVAENAGKMGRCVWTFAASTEEIRPDTGAVKIQGKIWKCPLPTPRHLGARELVRALSNGAEDALYTPVPGASRSFYDALVDCL